MAPSSAIGPGVRLGPYEIVHLLDSGGMGDIYRARDPRLGRDVAVKVMREQAGHDLERLRRFEDEARAAGALGHPNVLVVYDVGYRDEIPFLVTELLEGQTLRRHLTESGAVPPRKALDWAMQIAQGLAAAHARGIVHRDLKPANLFLTRDGRIKILDFGLAKLRQDAAAAADEPTVTAERRTASGVLLGTVGYMAPEQVRGESAGPPADIFALGIVLYALLAGHPPFERDTAAETLAAILKDDPPNLPPSVPPALDRLVRRCLEKRPEDRFQSAHDLSLALDALSGGSGSSAGLPVLSSASRLSRRQVLAGGGAALGLVGLGAGTAAWLRRAGTTPPVEPVQMTALLPPGATVAVGPGMNLSLALSPDGRTLVVAATDAAGQRLYRRTFDRLEATPIPGTEGGLCPFFSPDGEWIGFFADRRLKRVPVGGGTPVDIADAPGGFPAGATWTPDDRIVFASGAYSPLRLVGAQGGTAEPVTMPEAGQGHLYPHVLPDGRTVLFSSRGAVHAHDLLSGHRTSDIVQGTSPLYATTGHLILTRGTTLLAAPLDTGRLELAGPLVPLVDGVAYERSNQGAPAHVTVSPSGTLAYVPAATAYALVLIAADGTERVLAEEYQFENPQFSPDGRQLVVTTIRRAGATSDLVLHDLVDRASPAPLTFDGGRAPVWMSNGAAVTYSHLAPGEAGIYVRASDGRGQARQIVALSAFHWLVGWTPDDFTLAYGVMDEAGPDGITRGSIMARANGESRRVVGPGDTWGGRLSPDGRHLAYYSQESGSSEVYVTPFPEGGTRWLIAEGTDPSWSPDGTEVYYRSGNRLMAAPIDTSSGVRALSPRLVVEPFSPPLYDDYDIHPDGRTLALVRPAGSAQGREITVVLNWFTELQRLMRQ